jgi:hypothetical protein
MNIKILKYKIKLLSFARVRCKTPHVLKGGKSDRVDMALYGPDIGADIVTKFR